jgi:hypothetical protein
MKLKIVGMKLATRNDPKPWIEREFRWLIDFTVPSHVTEPR